MRRIGGAPLTLSLVVLVACGALLADDAPATETDAAAALLESGDPQAAADAYRAIIEDWPDQGPAWLGLGRALRASAEYAESIQALERAIELEHEVELAMFEIARSHALAGEGDESVRWLHRMANRGSTARLAAANAAEFKEMRESPAFRSALDALRPCRAPEYRQFDFWLGNWEVVNRAAPDRPPSRNRISAVDDACVILEEYETQAGYTGVSLSYYDSADGRWHQTWIDNQGRPIVHSGGLQSSSMVLTDSGGDESPVNRTTWSPTSDGRVRQHWERSDDDGKTWSTVFDGIYTRSVGDSDRLGSRPRTSNTLVQEHLRRIVGEFEGENGQWSFEYGGVSMMLITDEEWDRLRIMAPIVEAEQLEPDQLRRMLQANFDRALDAKYALWRGGVWSTFVHPLGELSKEHLISAMRQVAALHQNYGGSYSSNEVVFGEN